jgi:hypothetical protein
LFHAPAPPPPPPPPLREPFATCPATLLFSMTKFFRLLPKSSSAHSSVASASRHREPDTLRSAGLSPGSGVVRKSSAADPATRQLAVSIVRHDVQLRGPLQAFPQPFWPRLRTEPDYALLCMSCLHPLLKNGIQPRNTLLFSTTNFQPSARNAYGKRTTACSSSDAIFTISIAKPERSMK